jgi:chromosome segregation protein
MSLNNISTENNKKKLNYSDIHNKNIITDFNSNLFNSEKNEIFNNIKIEMITTNNNENKENYYEIQIKIEKINFLLNKCFKIIKYKILLIYKLKFFLKLKSFSQINKNNLFIKEILFIKLKNIFNQLLIKYKQNKKRNLRKYFLKWKNNLILDKIYCEMKNKIETKYNKNKEEKINKINNKINYYEKDYLDLTENYKNLNTFYDELKEKTKKYENNEIKLINKIKYLKKINEDKKKEIENYNINNSNHIEKEINYENNNYFVNNDFSFYKKKIKSLERQIECLNEENKKKEYTMSAFIIEMDKLIFFHENNIENNQNYENFIFSPKITNNNICFTSLGSLKKNTTKKNNYSLPKNILNNQK